MREHNTLPVLTENGRKLVQRLAELPKGWQTAAALAETIGVSRRTVLRELSSVEQWMDAAGFCFVRSPGQGILLDEAPSARAQIIRLVSGGNDTAALSKEERRLQLLTFLLSAEEPVKTYALFRSLSVSEHTLSADLDWADEWFRPYKVVLCRRPGVGVWLDADPEARRRAVGALIRSQIPEQKMRAVLQKSTEHFPLAGLMDPEIFSNVQRILQNFEQEEDLQFTDTGFLSLAVHCSLTIQQLKAGKWGLSVSGKSINLQQAARLAVHLERAFSLKLPSAEVRHLALYLDAYGGSEDPDASISVQNMELHNLAAVLISAMEKEMGVDLYQYPSLAKDLCNHLHPMLYRIEQGVIINNPQLNAVQTQYPVLWAATRSACDHAQKLLQLVPIPDAEAGYLAMHFGAILEKESLSKMRVRAVVACPYGMASSKFLSSQLIREFPILHIAASCSVRELRAEDLRQQGIDLIISTVPVSISYPQVCVNTVLKEIDRKLLQSAIEQAQSSTANRRQTYYPDDLRYAGHLSATLLELLDTLEIRTIEVPENRLALIQEASRLFCAEPVAQDTVEQLLLKREALGDTYIKPLRALLLHCRTNAVLGCRAGYLRAEPPVYENGQIIQGALVLLAPDGPDQLPIQVIQAVSSLLIEEPELIAAFRAGSREKAAALLEQELGRQFRYALNTHNNT